MSLVVAKKEGKKIHIVSDTKLTNTNNLNKMELPAPEEFSAVKTIIINSILSVSFAGEVPNADEAIKFCRNNLNLKEILNHLLEVNIKSGNETEFIVCLSIPPYEIYEVKDSRCQSTNSAWIGDQRGFNIFQKNFLLSSAKDQPSKMEEALTAVIESNVLGVNGFLISVSNETGVFDYKHYMKTYMPGRTYYGSHVLDIYGTVGEGGYAVSVFGGIKNDVLAVHIRQNRYGIIFNNPDGGYLKPEVYRDVDEHEFNEITERLHKFKPMGIYSSLQKSYFERGGKAAKQRNFNKAIEFYELGLKTGEKTMDALLHLNIGVCFTHLLRHSEAAKSFNEAVKLNRSLQSEAIKFIKQFASRK